MKLLILNLDPLNKHGEMLNKAIKDDAQVTLENIKGDKIQALEKAVTKLHNKEYERMFVINDFSALPFMIMGKHKDIVVAEVSDKHSSFMTLSHNNASVLSLSTTLLTEENLIDVAKGFVHSSFEGGRHMVRIDMLNKLLTQEDK